MARWRIAVLWAMLIGVGYTLLDFSLRTAMWFMAIAPPVGFFLSGWLQVRAERRVGLEARREHVLHWGFMFVLSGAVLSIASSNQLSGWVTGQLFTLVSGAMCFYGGLHLDRRFLWPGVVLVLGSALMSHLGPYPWTAVGWATAASLIASAVWMRPGRVEANGVS